MASHLTPSKRPFQKNSLEPNGRGKWQKTKHVGTLQSQLKIQPGVPIFRVLCPASKSGNVIGKGGGIIAKIRQETGAKIKVDETIPGCDERVIIITALEKGTEVGNEQDKENDEGAVASAEGDNEKESSESKEEKEDSSPTTNSKSEKVTPSALKALWLVFERIFASEEENEAGDESSENPSVSLRLLVLSSQAGFLLGKGGSVIKQMSADSGSEIRVSKEKLPMCASSQDEIVQITGEIDSVRKGLNLVAQLLFENPPRDSDVVLGANPSGSSSRPSFNRSEGLPPGLPPNYHLPLQGPSYASRPFDIGDHRPNITPFPSLPEALMHGHPPVPAELLTFRLLCSNDRVGSVIGKGGNIIKTLQHDTGCEIKIIETVPESEDRIIVISGPAHPSDGISPAQNAILHVQRRIVLPVPDNKESPATCRLLVSPNQIGCLLGKGGGVIAEMRKLSGAHIRVLSKDQIPKGVPENDEVVQINGDFEATQEALMQITARLRNHLFRDRIPALNPNMRPPFGLLEPPFGPYVGRHESPPSRLYPNMPPFQKDFMGRHLDERSAFAHSHGPLGADRSGPWTPKGMTEIGGPMSIPDFPGGGSQRRIGGFPGPSQSSMIPNITVDVIVPRSIVSALHGEDGGCLNRIREFSEAKITIAEPRPEAMDTAILISGAPDQMHAAQSLIQAFVLSESLAP